MSHRRAVASSPLCGFAAALMMLVAPASAREFTLTPGGSMTIQQALDQAQPGDTIKLAAGVYAERIRFPRSGEFGKPITVEGEDGAVIDGRVTTELKWEPAFDIAPGLYRAAIDWRPWHITADGKTVTQIYYKRTAVGSGEWAWTDIFRDGPDKRGFDGLEALALVNDDEHQLYVRFKDERDPSTLQWSLGTKQPTVTIDGVDRVVLRNVDVRSGWIGVYFANTLGSVVEDCRIGPTHHGIWLAENADRCTVRFNEITLDPWGVTGPLPNGEPRGRQNWTHWLAVKVAGYWDSFGIHVIHSSGGHQIHDNHIHHHWGGIDEWASSTDQNHGLNVHHNLVTDIADDGLEPSGSEKDGQWHDNIVINSTCAFRFKHVSSGPLYVYRNFFLHSMEDFRNFDSVETSPEVYVYHNTSTAPVAMHSNYVHKKGTENYHYFNNLYHCEYWWGSAKSDREPEWTSNHNVFVRRGSNERWAQTRALAAKLGMDTDSKWVENGEPGFADLANRDLSLAAGSPAIDAGTVLKDKQGRPLPGLKPGYFTGTAPDAGALEYGQPMPQIPRRREDVSDLPTAGAWPEADAQLRQVVHADRVADNSAPHLDGDGVQRWAGAPKKRPGESGRPVYPDARPTGTIDPAALAQAGPNLLDNGDFARVTGDQPEGWQVALSGMKHRVYVDKEGLPNGIDQALRVDISGNSGALGQISKWVSGLTPGKKYRVTGWLNGSAGAVAMVQVKLYADGKETQRIDSAWNQETWTPIAVEFTADKDGKAGVICRFKQNDYAQGKTIWFANLHVGEATP